MKTLILKSSFYVSLSISSFFFFVFLFSCFNEKNRDWKGTKPIEEKFIDSTLIIEKILDYYKDNTKIISYDSIQNLYLSKYDKTPKSFKGLYDKISSDFTNKDKNIKRWLEGIAEDHLEEKDLKNIEDFTTKYKSILSSDEIDFLENFVGKDNAYEIYRSYYNEKRDSPLEDISKYLSIPLFILLVFRKFIETNIYKALEYVKENIIKSILGSKHLINNSIKEYRKCIKEKYSKIKVLIGPDIAFSFDELYVPISLRESHSISLNSTHDSTLKGEKFNAYYCVNRYKRILLTGVPGSGKTLFMKQLLYSYAMNKVGNGQPYFPIFVELHRLSLECSIESQLEDILSDQKVDRPKQIIKHFHENGKLLVLFDGLDEVQNTIKDKIITEITNYINRHSKCRIIITCRTAVYNDEFHSCVDRTFTISEFSDYDMKKFLNCWENHMPQNKTIQKLEVDLDNRPHIKVIARNPLLLTLISFLYCQPDFYIPASRSEFYKEALLVLFSKLRPKKYQNQFDRNKKEHILQHIAFYCQSQNVKDIKYNEVITEIKSIADSINLDSNQASEILREIVEQNGVLLKIDDGRLYRFMHLTLQEYFTALYFDGRPKDLLKYYNENTPQWREIVKLWCGIENDCTGLVQTIYYTNNDSMMALECLADAKKIAPDVSNEIINNCLSFLDGNLVIKQTFASLISFDDHRQPRSTQIFNLLSNKISDIRSKDRIAAAEVLAYSNIPKAAEVLSKFYNERIFKNLLLSMGDLAIPPLLNRFEKSEFDIINDLCLLNTPLAIKTIVEFMWNKNQQIAIQSALVLSNREINKEVIGIFNECELSECCEDASKFSWVWFPFRDTTLKNPSSELVIGQISLLLSKATWEQIKPYCNIDERLLVPHCVINSSLTKTIKSLRSSDLEVDELHKNLGCNSEEELKTSQSSCLNIFNKLSIERRSEIVKRIKGKRISDINDWKTMFTPSHFDISKSKHYYLAIILFSLTITTFLLYPVITQKEQFKIFESVVAGLLNIAMFRFRFKHLKIDILRPSFIRFIAIIFLGILPCVFLATSLTGVYIDLRHLALAFIIFLLIGNLITVLLIKIYWKSLNPLFGLFKRNM